MYICITKIKQREKSTLNLSVLFILPMTLFAQDQTKIAVEQVATTNGNTIYMYQPTGVCSILIEIEIDKKDVIQSVKFTRGCNGNAKGIGALIRGMEIDDAKERLEGITCGNKSTSCPDQLSKALVEINKARK